MKASKGITAAMTTTAMGGVWVEEVEDGIRALHYTSCLPSYFCASPNGRWYMSKNIQEMIDWLEFKLKTN